MYETHSCLIYTFLNKFQIIIQHSPKHCPIIRKGDFNVNIRKKTTMEKINKNFMDKV
jgi:hypothetical protein